MTTSLLAALALLAGWLSPRILGRFRWLARVPRVGVAVWLAAVAGMSAAVVGSGVAATIPLIRDVGGIQEFVHRCPQWVAAIVAHPGPLAAALIGTTAVLVLVMSAVCALTAQVRQLRADSRRHVELLIAIGQANAAIAVVPDSRPAAWSLAADKGHVVVTSAAVSALSSDELAAVVAHEEAHLRGRHHLLLTTIRAAGRALPCPLTRASAAAISEYLEMRADDVAAARRGRDTVANALLRLTAVLPAGALGAGGGETALRRLRRLLEPAPAPRARAGLLALSAATALVVPIVITGLAAATVVPLHFCPLP